MAGLYRLLKKIPISNEGRVERNGGGEGRGRGRKEKIRRSILQFGNFANIRERAKFTSMFNSIDRSKESQVLEKKEKLTSFR